jgi:hypothetical protein
MKKICELLRGFEQVVSWLLYHGSVGHTYTLLTTSQIWQNLLFYRTALLLCRPCHTFTVILVSHTAVVNGTIKPQLDVV